MEIIPPGLVRPDAGSENLHESPTRLGLNAFGLRARRGQTRSQRFERERPLARYSLCSLVLALFLGAAALDLDDVDRVGTGLSFALELWEFDRAFSPFADDDVSLLERRFRRSPGMSEETGKP